MPKLDLDALEARAVKVISQTYSPMSDDITARFWIQKGIEGMRCAVAEAQLGEVEGLYEK